MHRRTQSAFRRAFLRGPIRTHIPGAHVILTCLFLVIAAAPFASASASLEPATQGQRDRIQEIIREVRDKKDGAPIALYEELGQMKTFDAFKALETTLGELQRDTGKIQIFSAMRHFAAIQEDELGERVIARVLRAARGKNKGEAVAAAAAFKSFGTAASDALYDVAKNGSVEDARAHAIGGIRERLSSNPDREALAIILDGVKVNESGTRPQILNLLRRFRSKDAFDELTKYVGRPQSSGSRKRLIIVAMGGHHLGQSDVIDVGADKVLSKAATQRDQILQYYALTSMAQRGGTFNVRLIGKLSAAKDPTVRRAALLVAFLANNGKADPIKLSRDDDPIARQAAAITFGARDGDESLDVLHGLTGDEDRIVRAEAVRQIGGRRDTRSVETLIARLELEEGRMRADIRDALEVITGRDYGLNASVWAKFWKAEGSAFAVPSVEELAEARKVRKERVDPNGSSVAFYGIDIVSNRFALIIDTSGSMQAKAYTGPTRIDVAKAQLAKTIQRLRNGVLFNVIPFSGRARPMEAELMTMGPEQKEAALKFAEDLAAAGGTNIHDALEAAFADTRVDSIYLMSDGAPSAGPIVDATELRAEVARWNSVRGIVIHCIAVGQDHQLLKALAADSGGKYVRVD